MILPGLFGVSSWKDWSPSEQTYWGPQNFLGLGGWKECPLQLISKPLGDPGIPLPGPLFAFPRTLSRRLSTSRPLGCTVGWFRGRLFWTTSQVVRGPAGGDSPGSSTRREGVEESVWEGSGWDLSLAPLGAGPTANSAPTAGPSCAAFLRQGTASRGWLRGDYMSEVPAGSSLSLAVLPRKLVHRCCF